MVTTASVSKALKEVYGSRPADQLNSESRLYSLFEKSETARWEGEVFVESLRVNRNRGIKATAEGGYLPNAGQNIYEELRIPQRWIHGEIGVTMQTMKTASSNRAAFVNIFEEEINGLVEGMVEQINRMLWGEGSGKLALVQGDIGAGGTTTIPVDTPGGVAGTVNGARFIRPNMVLAFHAAAPANNTPLAVRTVVSIAADGTSIVVDSNLSNTTAPDNGIITLGVTRASVSEGSYDLEPMGLLGIIDDATYKSTIHGLDRTTANGSVYKANVLSNVGNLDEIVLHRLIDKCDNFSGKQPDWYLCEHAVHREVIGMTIGDKRFSGDQLMRPDAGISGGGAKSELTFGGTQFLKERHCPYGTLFGVNSKTLMKYVTVPGEWAEEDGAILFRDGNIDQFRAIYRIGRNHAAKAVNSSFVARGINVTVDPVNAN